jgi:hypothetical protein
MAGSLSYYQNGIEDLFYKGFLWTSELGRYSDYATCFLPTLDKIPYISITDHSIVHRYYGYNIRGVK